MSGEKAARPTGSDEIAAVSALVEPWLYAESAARPFFGAHVPDLACGPYEFEAVVKPRNSLPGETAAGLRALLLRDAEAALERLAEAGWQLAPLRMTMEFTTRVNPLTQTISGELFKPAEQYGIELRMRFSVDRAR